MKYLIVLLLAMPAAFAEVSLPPVFSDHMVLQRDIKVPVFGKAMPGERLVATFRDQSVNATADAEGNWKLRLAAMNAGGPHDLKITGANEIVIKDVLVGEVWVGSGQSNMAGGAGGYAKNDEVLAKIIAGGPYPKLRYLRGKGQWMESNPKTMNGFSALMLSFGHALQQELDVPVGIMVGAVGGTPSGRWLTNDMVMQDPGCQALFDAIRKDLPRRKELYAKQHAAWEERVAKLKEQAEKAGKKPRLPRKPNPPLDPDALRDGYFGNLYNAHIKPMEGYGIKGVLWDQGESGTMVNDIDQFTMMGALIKGWRKAWAVGDFPFLYVQKPSGGGPAWDSSRPVTRMADKPGKLPGQINPRDNGKYRALHTRIRQHPNTAMVTSLDLGSGVHPRNKSGYGSRAARVAMGFVYGKDVEIYGPIYKSHHVKGSALHVSFDHGKGLAFKHADVLQGFAIAGKDKVFHWAKAEIKGNVVILQAKRVPDPVAVRYAWARNRPWANLFNGAGLPALSFRSDKW